MSSKEHSYSRHAVLKKLKAILAIVAFLAISVATATSHYSYAADPAEEGEITISSVDSQLREPQAESQADRSFSFTCQAQSVDVFGTGMKTKFYPDLSEKTLTIPGNAIWSVLQLAGKTYYQDPPQEITFQKGTEELPAGDVSRYVTTRIGEHPGYSFEFAGEAGETYSVKTDADGNIVDDVDSDGKLLESTEGFLAYVAIPSARKKTAVGETTIKPSWGGDKGYPDSVNTAEMELTLPEPLPMQMDVHVKASFIEKDPRCHGEGNPLPECTGKDHRIVVLRARAGGVEVEKVITDAEPDRYQLNIEEIVLPNVPADTQQVKVDLYSPQTPEGVDQFTTPGDEYEAYGDSAYLTGAIAWHDCVDICDPAEDICCDDWRTRYRDTNIKVTPRGPIQVGEERTLSFTKYNRTSVDHTVSLSFQVSGLGIGQWFDKIKTVNDVTIPAGESVTESVSWNPSVSGHYCVRVKMTADTGCELVRRKNINTLPPDPGCHMQNVQVCNSHEDIRTYHLDLINNGGDAGCEGKVLPENLTIKGETCVNAQVQICTPECASCSYRLEYEEDTDGILFESDTNTEACNACDETESLCCKATARRYADDRIQVSPMPIIKGQETTLSFTKHNRTSVDHKVTFKFYASGLGIGQWFRELIGTVEDVTIPAGESVTKSATWNPPLSGHHCVKVTTIVEDEGCQVDAYRNLDIQEPGHGCVVREIDVCNTSDERKNFELGIRKNAGDFGCDASIVPAEMTLSAGRCAPAKVQVCTPQCGSCSYTVYGDGIEGEVTFEREDTSARCGRYPLCEPTENLCCDVRKDTTVHVSPRPVIKGQETSLSITKRNHTRVDQEVTFKFYVAGLGIGQWWDKQHIGTVENVTIPAGETVTESATWSPGLTGHYCAKVVMIVHGEHSCTKDFNHNLNIHPPEIGCSTSKMQVCNDSGEAKTFPLEIIKDSGHVDCSGRLVAESESVTVQDEACVDVEVEICTPKCGMECSYTVGYADDSKPDTATFVKRSPNCPTAPCDPTEDVCCGDPRTAYRDTNISVAPQPIIEGQNTTLSFTWRNRTSNDEVVTFDFFAAGLGIGQWGNKKPIGTVENVPVAAGEQVTKSADWYPPKSGHYCTRVEMTVHGERSCKMIRNRNLNVGEKSVGCHQQTIDVCNDTSTTQDYHLALTKLSGHASCTAELDKNSVTVEAGACVEVEVGVCTPQCGMNGDDQCVYTVGYADGDKPDTVTITKESPDCPPPGGGGGGGDTPPGGGGGGGGDTPPGDTPPGGDTPSACDDVWATRYIDTNINVSPYPVLAGQETTLSFTRRNRTATEQVVTLKFYVSGLGVGQWFDEIDTLTNVSIPANGTVTKSVTWHPGNTGHYCVRVKMIVEGKDGCELVRQRNIDIWPIQNGCQKRSVKVCNPDPDKIQDINLSLVKQEGSAECNAQLMLAEPTVTVKPGQCVDVEVKICTPCEGHCVYHLETDTGDDGTRFETRGTICPCDATTDICCNEPGFAFDGKNIVVNPYPVVKGQETTLSFTKENKTAQDHTVSFTFYISGLGIGQWFDEVETINDITIPAGGSVTKSVKWSPPVSGHYCVRIKMVAPDGYGAGKSCTLQRQRNLDIMDDPIDGCVEREINVCNHEGSVQTINLNTAIEGADGCTMSVSPASLTLKDKECVPVTVKLCAPCGETCTYRVEHHDGGDGVIFKGTGKACDTGGGGGGGNTPPGGGGGGGGGGNTPPGGGGDTPPGGGGGGDTPPGGGGGGGGIVPPACPTCFDMPTCEGDDCDSQVLPTVPDCNPTIRTSNLITSTNWGVKETWDPKRIPNSSDIVQIGEGRTVTAPGSQVSIAGLCNHGTLQSDDLQDININSSGMIYNAETGKIIGKDAPDYMSLYGRAGASITMRATPFFNEGTIQAGRGSDSEQFAGSGGETMILAKNTVNSGTICGGDGGDITSDTRGAKAGNGGETHIWGKYRGPGGSLINVGTSCAGKGGNVQTRSQIPGMGGRLKLISLPNVHLKCGTHYAGDGGCDSTDTYCSRAGYVVIEPTTFCLNRTTIFGWNVTLFGGNNANINFLGTGNNIRAVNNVTLAVGNGGIITPANINGAIEAGGKVEIKRNTILRDVSVVAPQTIDMSFSKAKKVAFQIMNGGPEKDTYDIDITDEAGWNFTYPKMVEIEGIDTADVELETPAIVETSSSVTNIITVTVTSQADPSIKESKVLRVGAPRGDCNNNGVVNGTDIVAIKVEILDSDRKWTEAPTSSFAGVPEGCDAKPADPTTGKETVINGTDLVCTSLKILNGPDACGAPTPSNMASTSALKPVGEPSLSIEGLLQTTPGQNVVVPVSIETDGEDIAGVTFSLGYDPNVLSLNEEAVSFDVPEGFEHREAKVDQEKGIVKVLLVSTSDPISTFDDGEIATLSFNVVSDASEQTLVQFTQDLPVSFSSSSAEDIDGTVENGFETLFLPNIIR